MELSKRDRLKLLNELNGKLSDLENANKREKLKLTMRINEIIDLLGFGATGNTGTENNGANPPPINSGDNASDDDASRRMTRGQRQKANNQAIDLLRRIKSGEIETVTADMINTLKGYTGSGGNLVSDDGLKGSIYEYYTPKPIAGAAWEVLKQYGFAGGKVLDPSSGTGIFTQTMPQNTLMDAIELDDTSGSINQLINPNSKVKISPFEAVASRTPDNSYDAVITNVPFGTLADRGANAALDPKYSNKSLEYYFILRSLDKLKYGGLAAFITPPRCMSKDDTMQSDLRYYASLKAEFLGAWRLPNSVFGNAHADTITDIIFFRKHSADNTQKIKELLRENPQALRDNNVLWETFLKGDYFKGEGKRFVLGEFVAKDPNKIRDVDRVINGASMADIAKMITKFPDSRINWDALELIPTEPIAYKDGDTISQDGVTYVFKDGKLAVQSSIKADSEMMQLSAKLSLASIAVNNKVTFDEANKFYLDSMRRSAYDVVPDWLLKTMPNIARFANDESEQRVMFNAIMTGYALAEVIDTHAAGEPFNYMAEYPFISDAIKNNASYANNLNASLPTEVKQVVRLMTSFYSPKKTEFSLRWKGETQRLDDLQVDVTTLSQYQRYEKLKYGRNNDGAINFVSIEKLKEVLGSDFDPYKDDDWCINADGTGAIHKDDYYLGAYADFLQNIDNQLQSSNDEKVKQKLLRQRAIADSQVSRLDVKRLSYDMRSPFISNADKLDYLQKYIDARFALTTDADGTELFVLKNPVSKSEDDYIKQRFAKYLNGQTARTGTQKKTREENPELEAKRKLLLDKLVAVAENDFGIWAKANTRLMSELDKKANALENLYFTQSYNGEKLVIQGIRDEFQGRLHDYQNNATRQYARNFAGLLSFDVGLGKTFTALASVQYVQSIGVKTKSFFVLPASVLSNWRKEAATMYTDEVLAQCLFVGLRIDTDKIDATGNPAMSYDSSKVDEDLNRILENRHKKIFMSLESFQKIPLKSQTIDDYIEYMKDVDSAFKLSDKQSDSVRNDTKAEKLTDTGQKSAGVPYFEDMGCDSLIGDEFHVYKNSKEVFDFKGGKFLSLPEASSRGLDAQIKCWYIRDTSPHGDGVLGLSATPITNSPLEIYSMISLSVGEKRISDALMGVKGADAFMQAVCDISTGQELNIIGELRQVEVFNGLKNLSLLRGLLGSVANIKTAEEVNLKIPEKEVLSVPVNLTDETIDKLRTFKDVYAYARAYIDPRGNISPFELEVLTAFSEKYGEPIELLASPFNLISKMTDLIMDDDLVHKFSKWQIQDSQLDTAKLVAEAFNKLKVTEDRTRLTLLSTEDDIVSRKTKKTNKDDEEGQEVLKVKVKALVQNGELILDSVDFETQQRLLKLCEKQGLVLTVSFSPKISAMLENFKKEEANPIIGSKAKQIIFCDNKGLHNKLKQVIIQECGIPASEIIIINGVTGKDAADMQDFQDGFNAMPEDNNGKYRYRVAICNKKAEVGINLQKGTQAIHHLTTGWTPDSIQQRDGRGVRQGNKAAKVKVYMYNANGTFDEYKLMLVGKKSDWIGSVLSKDGGEKVAIGGQISSRDYEDLVNSVGDADAIRKARERIEMNELIAQVDNAVKRQQNALNVIVTQQEYLTQKLTVRAFLESFIIRALGIYELHHGYAKAASKEDVSEGYKKRNSEKRDSLEPKLQEVTGLIKTGISENAKSRLVSDSTDLKSYWMGYIASEYSKKGGIQEYAKRMWFKDDALIVDSDLYNLWQSEKTLAQNMIDESVSAFKSENVGLNHNVVDYYIDNKAFISGSKSIVDGSIVFNTVDERAFVIGVTKEWSGVSVTGQRQPMIQELGDKKTGKLLEQSFSPDSVIAALDKYEIYQPYEANYQDGVKKLAKLQDDLINAGVSKINKDTNLYFSDILPDVLKYTTAKEKVWLEVTDYFMPPPYFKYILPLNDALKSLDSEIYNQFSAVFEYRKAIVRYSEVGQISLKDESVTLVENNDSSYRYFNDAASSLVDYMIAKGVPFSPISVGEVCYPDKPQRIMSFINRKVSGVVEQELRRLTLGMFENEDELFNYIENFIKAKFDFDFDKDLVSNSEKDTPRDYILSICSDFMSVLKGLLPKPVLTESEEMYAKAVSIAVNNLVSIKDAAGQSVTKSNRDTIKRYSELYGKKKAGWDTPSVSWTIPLEAYKKLVDDYDFMKKVDVIAPVKYRL